MADTRGEELDPDGLPKYPSWSLFRSMTNPAALTAEGSEAALWALSVLEGYFGASWPRRQFQRQGWVPASLAGYSGRRHELPRLLSLACNVEWFKHAGGAQAVRKLVSGTATPSAWRHFCLQLEVARAAAFVGEFNQFEPTIDGTDCSGDLDIVLAGTNLIVEVTSVSRSDGDLRQERFERRLHWALMDIALETNVAIDVRVKSTDASEEQVQAWQTSVRGAADHVVRSGVGYRDLRGFASIVMSPASHDGPLAPGVTKFEGAVHSRDAWLRIRDALRGKARQTLGASNVWIRLDAVEGLFALTDWASRPMSLRTEQIAGNLRAAFVDFDHVHGVVLSSGAGLSLNVDKDPLGHQRADAHSATLLRSRTARGLVRETVILPLTEAGQRAAAAWIEAYIEESMWLDADLGKHGWSLDRMRPAATTDPITP